MTKEKNFNNQAQKGTQELSIMQVWISKNEQYCSAIEIIINGSRTLIFSRNAASIGLHAGI